MSGNNYGRNLYGSFPPTGGPSMSHELGRSAFAGPSSLSYVPIPHPGAALNAHQGNRGKMYHPTNLSAETFNQHLSKSFYPPHALYRSSEAELLTRRAYVRNSPHGGPFHSHSLNQNTSQWNISPNSMTNPCIPGHVLHYTDGIQWNPQSSCIQNINIPLSTNLYPPSLHSSSNYPYQHVIDSHGNGRFHQLSSIKLDGGDVTHDTPAQSTQGRKKRHKPNSRQDQSPISSSASMEGDPGHSKRARLASESDDTSSTEISLSSPRKSHDMSSISTSHLDIVYPNPKHELELMAATILCSFSKMTEIHHVLEENGALVSPDASTDEELSLTLDTESMDREIYHHRNRDHAHCQALMDSPNCESL